MNPDRERTDPDSSAAPRGSIEAGIRLAAGIIAPTTLITSLLFYFGYVATDAFYEYFGVDAATLQFSTQDYLLRSVGALYVPIGAILLLALIVTWLHPTVRRAAIRGHASGPIYWTIRAVAILALLAVGYGVLSVAVPSLGPRSSLRTPLILAFGVAVLSYLRQLLRGSRQRDSALRGNPATSLVTVREALSTGLVVALLVLIGFWAANSYAAEYGRGQAIDLGNRLSIRPEVVLDTQEELFLQLPGVTETSLPSASAGQHFHFRYRGLRLLAQSGNKMFFIPSAWSADTGRALMLENNTDIRVQFSAGG